MDGFKICKEIVGLNDSIIRSEIAEKGTVVAAHAKSGSVPSLERLLVQTELYINMLHGQEHLGRAHYLLAHNDNIDLYFFPVVINGRNMILAIMIAVPYEHDQLVGKVREYIGKLRLGE